MLFDHDYDRVLTFLSFVLFLGITIFLSSCLYMLFISIIFVHTWVLVMGLVGLYRDGIPQRGNVRKESILLLDDDDYGKTSCSKYKHGRNIIVWSFFCCFFAVFLKGRWL